MLLFPWIETFLPKATRETHKAQEVDQTYKILEAHETYKIHNPSPRLQTLKNDWEKQILELIGTAYQLCKDF